MSHKHDTMSALDAWALLRAGKSEASDLQAPTLRTDISTPAGPVRYSLGNYSEARILVPVPSTVSSGTLASTRFLKVTFSNYLHAGRSLCFVDLTCLSRNLELVFGEVVEEILTRIAGGMNGLEAAATTISDFRDLLERNQSSTVAQTAIVGLVGELYYLNRLLAHSPCGWKAWRGPAGDRHDFRIGNSSLEVKTTSQAGNTVITIHGTDQLLPPSGGSLHLLHLTLEAVAGGLLSVSSLGQSALAKADDPAALAKLIGSAGCSNVDDPAWNAMAYHLESENLYKVSDGFPRIVLNTMANGSLPAGVSDVVYKVDLSCAQEHRLDEQAAASLEKEFASC
ncbi:PD-(D/E)XK motif protein [Vogesella indigofera]|uniref:PD-(D/E)XK motif protein n=1 Tax=Vogesella indigofera TaxID=45465 RepID=UPI00234EFDD2|nr:PD-(D/E)XK motif protein [Vogesella indigofera]MDC7710059.1 PD-(D/E)XK motif protein [Vogesella indigofera]